MNDLEGPNLLEWLWRTLVPGHPLSAALLAAWLVMGLLVVAGAVACRRARLVPGGLQNVFEAALDFVGGMSRRIAGPAGPRYLPLFATLFLFILLSNWLGLVPGFVSPTANLSINAAMALVVAGSSEVLAVRQQGVGGYLRHFCGPPYWLAPIFVVIRVLEVFTRPLSLSMRLFGNMMAKEIILGVLVYLVTLFFFSHNLVARCLIVVPFLLRPAILLLGVLVGFVQALVFTALAMSYIGSAFESH